ncbi:MAG: hypothetical protein DI556_00380 [Rhodovulum sulfidophilum]|uniref:DUF1194 domain-containing protein n=1 Tax=Rhodovulum sulfidophilum TaxID=35806 RepID=A0A2W5NF79_RHOSU|nr:MAG: hypothetical protein DI556_00380 [Rhodovulum sulfidophilum]
MVRLALLLALGLPAAASAEQCRIALALGLDVSSSVDGGEYLLQTRGLAAALTSEAVRNAFLGAPGEVVALNIYEWSGRRQQMTRQDWIIIRSPEDLDGVAAQLLESRRSFEQYPTALGHAIIYGAETLARAPACAELKLDISGDGTNNDGIPPPLAAPDAPIVINGLVVGDTGDTLARYYENFVIRGPGAFVEIADDYDDFEEAMKRKLERELRPAAVSELGTPPLAPRL